ncbi:hypothetical protein M569_15444 [Genlisea aurea]|uniref:Pectin acetylesterase n=1 Tax=Genlisea aurea TaxID=192259 RepID=S8BYB8_9LAMI|nr:hypothetical protein M569_15444 [Genlisea aurea]
MEINTGQHNEVSIFFSKGDEWCTGTSCETYGREHTSYNKTRVTTLTGILSPYREKNPDFYNWNRVRAKYCDGASFMGDTVYFPNQTTVTRAGMRIFNVMMEDLMMRGLGNADNAVLAGGSAGGLAAMLHCDRFRESIPDVKRVKCISDSGFFLAG